MPIRILLHFVFLYVAFGSLSAREPYRTRCERKFDPSKQTEVQRQVRAYMDTVVFPRVSLSHVSFPDAIEWVQHHIAESAPASTPAEGRGISTFLKQRPGAREFFSVSLRSATLPQVLDAICKQHHYVWCVEPMILSITPRKQKFPIVRPRPSA